MKIHRNAKTTPTMRALLVQRVREQQWSPSEAAAAAGISVRTTQKWLRRYRLGGPPALEDASSRPHRSPHATPAAAVTRISELRRAGQRIWIIARAVGRPASTVSAILRRRGIERPRPARPPVCRYEWPAAGDLVHVDIKPLARIKGLAIASPAICRRNSAASATNTPTLRSTMPRGWPTSRCACRNAAPTAPGFWSGRVNGLPTSGSASGGS